MQFHLDEKNKNFATYYNERWAISFLAIYKHKDVNVDNIITKFVQQKGRYLALCLQTFQYQLK